MKRTRNVEISEEAELDLEDTFFWYENEMQGVGQKIY